VRESLSCCFDTGFGNHYHDSDIVTCGRFPWKAPTSLSKEQLSKSEPPEVVQISHNRLTATANWPSL
jgi:hypothetical protein